MRTNLLKRSTAAYSDELFFNDPDKHDNLCIKHFGNDSQMWDNRPKELIQKFLIDYMGNISINLFKIETIKNKSTGELTWIMHFFYMPSVNLE